jgi:acylphosphatase
VSDSALRHCFPALVIAQFGPPASPHGGELDGRPQIGQPAGRRPAAILRGVATRRVRVIASGRVQGVGFRWICAQEAGARGLAGFVRNLPDGRVEAAFEGDEASVQAMVEWSQEGPQWARVERLEVTEETPRGDPRFEIRP